MIPEKPRDLTAREEVQRRYQARRQLWTDALTGLTITGKTVLDAGTGEGYCTRFLAEQNPAWVVSVTCLEREIEPARQRAGEFASAIDFVVANLAEKLPFADASFDIVVADFLIAAVAAYTPYREIEVLRELARVLKPGGRLIATGWDATAPRRHRLEQALRGLFQLRSAMHLLQGVEPFREHPAFWMSNRLSELALPVERTVFLPDVHHNFDWLIASVRRAWDDLPDEALKAACQTRLDNLAAAVVADPQLESGYLFGRLYAVIACKLDGAILLSGPIAAVE